MRRPRGPGGRFLTADEIAAQNVTALAHPVPSASNDNDHDMDEGDDLKLDGLNPPPDPMSVINLNYRHHLSLSEPISQQPPTHHSHVASHSLSIHPPHQAPTMYPHKATLSTSSSSVISAPGTINTAPVTLSAPYSTAVQMHHVPHPHAHARHHHLNITSYPQSLYPPDSPSTNTDREHPTQVMIQFGAAGSPSI
jgi:nuclear transcription factor Y alpha